MPYLKHLSLHATSEKNSVLKFFILFLLFLIRSVSLCGDVHGHSVFRAYGIKSNLLGTGVTGACDLLGN